MTRRKKMPDRTSNRWRKRQKAHQKKRGKVNSLEQSDVPPRFLLIPSIRRMCGPRREEGGRAKRKRWKEKPNPKIASCCCQRITRTTLTHTHRSEPTISGWNLIYLHFYIFLVCTDQIYLLVSLDSEHWECLKNHIIYNKKCGQLWNRDEYDARVICCW